MESLETQTIHSTTYPAISPRRPELSNSSKNALVSGGGAGIGAFISRSLAESGVRNLAILGRNPDSLAQTLSQIQSQNPTTKVWAYTVDIIEAEALNIAIRSYAEAINGKIDLLVANAGYLPDPNAVVKANPEDWWKGFEVSVRGNLNLIQAFHPFAASRSRVAHITSAVIHSHPVPGFSSHHTCKAAASKLFEYYHAENPEISVIRIHPGIIGGTAMARKFADSVNSAGFPWHDPSLPGDFTVWALSDEAQFLNGEFVWATWDVEELKLRKGSECTK